jgi:3-isopropylmalate/(R)-2-methylmalate dehydratase large subunit
MTIVCGDSHTSTHGAFGALAFGIGTSEVEHVPGDPVHGPEAAEDDADLLRRELGSGVTPKDLILADDRPPRHRRHGRPRGRVRRAGDRGAGDAGKDDDRNMTIEAGGRAGMIAPDEQTFEWVRGRAAAPADFDAAVERWRRLPSDPGASFDTEVEIDAAAISPMVTWGTTRGWWSR